MSVVRVRWRKIAPAIRTRWRGPEGGSAALAAADPPRPIAAIIGPPGIAGPPGPEGPEVSVIDGGEFF